MKKCRTQLEARKKSPANLNKLPFRILGKHINNSMKSKRSWIFLLVATLATLWRLSLGQDAERCDPSYCRLPNCFCGGSQIPGDLDKERTPQFVLLTFDDAVNGLNRKFFEDLFKNRNNPNGCPIKVS